MKNCLTKKIKKKEYHIRLTGVLCNRTRVEDEGKMGSYRSHNQAAYNFVVVQNLYYQHRVCHHRVDHVPVYSKCTEQIFH